MKARPAKYLTLETSLHLTRADAWDLLWQPEGQRQWLGPDSRLDLRENVRVIFCDGSGPCMEAHLESIIDLKEVRFLVYAPPNGHTDSSTITIRIDLADVIQANGESGCIITIGMGPIPGHKYSEFYCYWSQRIKRLEAMDQQIQKRRRSPRQAVVLIHGIGEQQPGEILNSFLTSGVLGNKKWGTWVKPDQLSDLLELRKATLSGNKTRPTTDVYEVYWAHLIRDTTLGQVGGWLRRLLFRWPLAIKIKKVNNRSSLQIDRTIPPALTTLWVMVWITFLLLVTFFLGKLWNLSLPGWIPPWLLYLFTWPILLPVAGWLFKFFGKDIATNYLGDAARYLQPHPANIKYRQAIRSSGVSLLEKLHAMGSYDRIVVVGHSLGSVIAYDILSFAWVKLRRAHRNPTTRRRGSGVGPFQSLRRVEKAASEGRKHLNEEQILKMQQKQHEAWKDLRINTLPWLVTDLVTLGSPLTYADFLLSDEVNTIHKLKRNRSLPICPPWMQKVNTNTRIMHRFSYEKKYFTAVGAKIRTFTLYDHAALFAVTRWTNLYIPRGCLGISGDVISGPLGLEAGGLGAWIRDVRLEKQFLKFMHTWYWNSRTSIFHAWKLHRGDLKTMVFLKKWILKQHELSDNSRIQQLEKVLDLDVRDELEELLSQIPAYTLLD